VEGFSEAASSDKKETESKIECKGGTPVWTDQDQKLPKKNDAKGHQKTPVTGVNTI